MSWLVTGGAGYIGAHVVRAFLAEGIDTVVVDDLSSGQRRFVPDGVPFVDGSILDGGMLERAFEEQEGIIARMAAAKGFDEFYKELVSRLGEGQARALALKYKKA